MYLVTAVLVVLGFLGLCDAIFDKYFLWQLIEEKLIGLSNKTNFKLIFDLAFCKFCQRFWLSVFITLVVAIFLGFQIQLALVPFIVIGIHK